MSNWKTVTLGEISSEHGSFVDGPFGSNLKASEYIDAGTPIIRLQNIKPNEFLDKDIKYISAEKASELQRHDYQPGDLVISKLGDPCGVACVLPQAAGSGIIVADVTRFRVSEDIVDHQFVAHYLNSFVGARQVKKYVKGSTRQRINLGDLKKIGIPLPPLEEQRRIVELLDRAADIRRRAEAARAKARAIIPALFVDMFGDPATNPMGWDVVELGEACSIQATLRTPDPIDDAHLLIIGPDSIEKETGRLLNKPTVGEIKPISGKFQFSAGDVIYSKIRPKLRKATRLEQGGFCSADMYPLTPSAGVSGFFLLTYLLSDTFSGYAETNSTRAQMPKINREALFAHKLPIPPAQLMNAFEDTVSGIQATLAKFNVACELSANTQTALSAEVFA